MIDNQIDGVKSSVSSICEGGRVKTPCIADTGISNLLNYRRVKLSFLLAVVNFFEILLLILISFATFLHYEASVGCAIALFKFITDGGSFVDFI